jgi:2-polyprenyl-3-methyl-5-hydroxy-6-metoxy-1,4-benzoquinol methylase
MKDKYQQSIDSFNQFATEFENGFMELSLYDNAIETFCSSISVSAPKILELGCGPGNVTRRIKKHLPQAKITAIDLAENMITLARKNVSDVDFRVLDVRSIDQFTGPYDAIVAAFVLPFLSYEDSEKLIISIGKLLNPKGVVYLSTMEGSSENNGFETTSFSGKSEIHFVYYEVPLLTDMLKNAGIDILDIKKQPYLKNGVPILTDIIIMGEKNNSLNKSIYNILKP